MIRTLAAVGLGFVLTSSGCTCWSEFYTTGKGGSGGSGGTGGMGGSGATGGSGGTAGTGGVSMLCTPGEVVGCYSGPLETKGKGECHEGTQTCAEDGQSFGPCAGEQLPQPEECASPKDEDCDGLAPACKGLCVWSKAFGDSQFQFANGIATSQNEVAITGFFGGTVDFGAGPKTSAGGTDIFVAKFAADGLNLWSKAFGDADIQAPSALALDATGNMLVSGRFAGTVDFGDGPKTSAGGTDIFVAKLAANDGAPLWSKAFGDSKDQAASSVAVDSVGDLIVTGAFAGTVDFGDGAKMNAGGADIFIAKLAANDGAPLWSKAFGDGGSQVAKGVAIDSAGNAVVSGACSGVVNFGGGPLPCLGNADIFIAKFDPSGAHVWAQRFGDTTDQAANGIALDTGGNLLLTGFLSTPLDFGCGLLTPAGGADAFLVKVSP